MAAVVERNRDPDKNSEWTKRTLPLALIGLDTLKCDDYTFLGGQDMVPAERETRTSAASDGWALGVHHLEQVMDGAKKVLAGEVEPKAYPHSESSTITPMLNQDSAGSRSRLLDRGMEVVYAIGPLLIVGAAGCKHDRDLVTGLVRCFVDGARMNSLVEALVKAASPKGAAALDLFGNVLGSALATDTLCNSAVKEVPTIQDAIDEDWKSLSRWKLLFKKQDEATDMTPRKRLETIYKVLEARMRRYDAPPGFAEWCAASRDVAALCVSPFNVDISKVAQSCEYLVRCVNGNKHVLEVASELSRTVLGGMSRDAASLCRAALEACKTEARSTSCLEVVVDGCRANGDLGPTYLTGGGADVYDDEMVTAVRDAIKRSISDIVGKPKLDRAELAAFALTGLTIGALTWGSVANMQNLRTDSTVAVAPATVLSTTMSATTSATITPPRSSNERGVYEDLRDALKNAGKEGGNGSKQGGVAWRSLIAGSVLFPKAAPFANAVPENPRGSKQWRRTFNLKAKSGTKESHSGMVPTASGAELDSIIRGVAKAAGYPGNPPLAPKISDVGIILADNEPAPGDLDSKHYHYVEVEPLELVSKNAPLAE